MRRTIWVKGFIVVVGDEHVLDDPSMGKILMFMLSASLIACDPGASIDERPSSVGTSDGGGNASANSDSAPSTKQPTPPTGNGGSIDAGGGSPKQDSSPGSNQCGNQMDGGAGANQGGKQIDGGGPNWGSGQMDAATGWYADA